MKSLLGLALILSSTSAFSADWQCYPVVYHAGSTLNIDFSENARAIIIPANEAVDDFIHATTSTKVCVKGHIMGSAAGSLAALLAYDVKAAD